MVCRHGPNDPSCSSHRDYIPPYRAPIVSTPDAKNYEILKVEQVSTHLVMQVRYPNCSLCAFEGTKVMVFLNVSPLEAMRWKTIDPHFREDENAVQVNKSHAFRTPPKNPTEAPSPAARFPANANGWSDALAYARGKEK